MNNKNMEEHAEEFLKGLSIGTSGVSNSFGLWLGTILYPNDIEKQNALGELCGTIGELASAGKDVMEAKERAVGYEPGFRPGLYGKNEGPPDKNEPEPKLPGEWEDGIPSGGNTFNPREQPGEWTGEHKVSGESDPEAPNDEDVPLDP